MHFIKVNENMILLHHYGKQVVLITGEKLSSSGTNSHLRNRYLGPPSSYLGSTVVTLWHNLAQAPMSPKLVKSCETGMKGHFAVSASGCLLPVLNFKSL